MNTTIDFLDHIERESSRFRRTLATTDPEARVSSCPEWTAADLLWHLGEVQHFWATVVGEQRVSPAGIDEPARPGTLAGLFEFFDRSSAALVEVLSRIPDEAPAWSWYGPDQTAGFSRRRQAHEALIHRIDAEIVGGMVSAIDADLATDGIDEVLRIMFASIPDWGTHTIDGAVGTVRTTDTDRTWTIRLGRFVGTSPNTGTSYDEPTISVLAGPVTVSSGRDETVHSASGREHDDRMDAPMPSTNGGVVPTFSVAGMAADLDLWLWQRGSPDLLTFDGDGSDFTATIVRGIQ